MMFYETHLGYEIGRLEHFRTGIASSDNDMEARPTCSQSSDDIGQSKIVITQSDIELVEHQQFQFRVGHQLACLRPCRLRRGHIARAVLSFPGEALAHCMP